MDDQDDVSFNIGKNSRSYLKNEDTSSLSQLDTQGNTKKTEIKRQEIIKLIVISTIMSIVILFFIFNHDKKVFGSSEPKVQKINKIGEEANSNHFKINVLKIEVLDKVGSFLNRKKASSNAQFVAISYSFENITNQPVKSLLYNITPKISDNSTVYDIDIDASNKYDSKLDENEKVLSSINPGIKITASRVLEIPQKVLSSPMLQVFFVDCYDTIRFDLNGFFNIKPTSKKNTATSTVTDTIPYDIDYEKHLKDFLNSYDNIEMLRVIPDKFQITLEHATEYDGGDIVPDQTDIEIGQIFPNSILYKGSMSNISWAYKVYDNFNECQVVIIGFDNNQRWHVLDNEMRHEVDCAFFLHSYDGIENIEKTYAINPKH
jgi:hypothetical protein